MRHIFITNTEPREDQTRKPGACKLQNLIGQEHSASNGPPLKWKHGLLHWETLGQLVLVNHHHFRYRCTSTTQPQGKQTP